MYRNIMLLKYHSKTAAKSHLSDKKKFLKYLILMKFYLITHFFGSFLKKNTFLKVYFCFFKTVHRKKRGVDSNMQSILIFGINLLVAFFIL